MYERGRTPYYRISVYFASALPFDLHHLQPRKEGTVGSSQTATHTDPRALSAVKVYVNSILSLKLRWHLQGG